MCQAGHAGTVPRMAPRAPEHSFASDNAAGVLPEVMDALVAANQGTALAYGADPWTDRAVADLRERFDHPVDVAFCWGGTGANVVALQALLRPFEAVICPEGAHINVDECGAPERFTGSKLIDLPCAAGKLRPEQVVEQLHGIGDEHHVQPRVVSITQSTEVGTLYQPAEIAAICEVAHAHGLLVHVDGARIANATAALGGDLRASTVDAGVDVLSFGGTKAGLMYGEAVVFLTPGLADQVAFIRKQSAQLPSKMRYVSAQFSALLAEDRWLAAAGHANAMASRLADAVAEVPGVELSHRPEVNAVFARVPKGALAELQDWSFFWEWDPAVTEVRWMTSWQTTPDDVDAFVAGLGEIVAEYR